MSIIQVIVIETVGSVGAGIGRSSFSLEVGRRVSCITKESQTFLWQWRGVVAHACNATYVLVTENWGSIDRGEVRVEWF